MKPNYNLNEGLKLNLDTLVNRIKKVFVFERCTQMNTLLIH